MSDVSIRIVRAMPADARLAREAVVEVHERAPFEEVALHEFLADPACWLLLAIDDGPGGRDGGVVGSLNGYALRHPSRSAPQFLLYEIDVRPTLRGRGVGTALVTRFVDEARAAGAFEVWVITNQSNGAAMTMYERAGLVRPFPDDAMWRIRLPP